MQSKAMWNNSQDDDDDDDNSNSTNNTTYKKSKEQSEQSCKQNKKNCIATENHSFVESVQFCWIVEMVY